MNLTPKERERLTIFVAAEIARRRKDRGVPLNHPETIAYISDWCNERAREGQNVEEIRTQATQLLSYEDVRDGVPGMISTIQVEPIFPDGTKLVTVHDPIRADTKSDENDADGSKRDEADEVTESDEPTETQSDGGDDT
ncbi:urease subunit gamma (plasmid) [Natrinema zhouii]|uniref:urease subunit gamma n=1 Tax=Natrinema zhouii TaxID=1710539 RepID=UPI001CFFD599|nr:urease subunit gamma [Natrinema zhouii]UHQ98051.1 urease subunit gamma [Natrinema zhouii]